MKAETLIQALQSALPSQDWPWAFAAFQQDALIWQAMQVETTLQEALTRLGGQAERWSPANIALLTLNLHNWIDAPAQERTKPLATDQRARILRAYERFSQDATTRPDSLEEAACLAFALRERARLRHGWDGIASELPAKAVNAWRTALAVLFDLSGHPISLATELLSNPNTIPAGVHMLLAQPLPDNLHRDLWLRVLDTLEATALLPVLEHLVHQRQVLARSLAHTIQSARFSRQDAYTPQFQPWNQSEIARQIFRASVAARLSQLGGDLIASQRYSQQAQESTQALSKLLAEETLQNRIRQQLADDPAWALDASLDAGQMQQPMVLLELAQAGAPLPADSQIPLHPAALFAYSLHALNVDQDDATARRYALQAYAALPSEITLHSLAMVEQLARHLLHLECLPEAAQLTSHLLAVNPGSIALHRLLAKTEMQAGNLHLALEHALLATSLDPFDLEAQRELACIYENGQNWPAALDIQRKILQSHLGEGNSLPKAVSSIPGNRQLSLEDVLAFGHSALNAGSTDEAKTAAQLALDMAGQNGLVYILAGKVALIDNQLTEAHKHLQKAVQISAHKAEAWLTLADVQIAQEKPEAALHTMRMAVHAAPASPQLHSRLGELTLAQLDAPAQALPAFQRAADLLRLPRLNDPSEKTRPLAQGRAQQQPVIWNDLACKVAANLGDVYLRLGQVKEALNILIPAVQAQPAYLHLAQVYAHAQLADGNPSAAISALAVIVQAEPENDLMGLEYARALLVSGEDPSAAAATLQRILSHTPQHNEARALLAEAYAAQGEYMAALAAYQSVMDSPLFKDPRWMMRISLGLTHVAMHAERVELAIAVLQEAITIMPSAIPLYQKLSEAYLQAGLIDDARQNAALALQFSPNDPANLLWFAEHSMACEQPREALAAVQQAYEIEPQNAHIVLRLAELHYQTGNPGAAHKAFQEASQLPTLDDADIERLIQGLMHTGDAPGVINSLESLIGPLPEQIEILPKSILRPAATAYESLGQDTQAINLLDHALRHTPDDADILIQKAGIQQRRKQWTAAQATLEQVLTRHPSHAAAHALLSSVLAESGKTADALNHYLEALKANGISNAQMAQWSFAAALLAIKLLDYRTALDIISPAEYPDDPQALAAWQDALMLRCMLQLDAGHWSSSLESYALLKQAAPQADGMRILEARLQGDEDIALPAPDQWTGSDIQPLTAMLLTGAWIERGAFSEANEFLKIWRDALPRDTIAWLWSARSLIRAAEQDSFCKSLQIVQHAPGMNARQRTYRHQAESYLEQAITVWRQIVGDSASSSRTTNLPLEIQRWQARFQVAFLNETAGLTAQTLMELSRQVNHPEDAAAYITSLTRLGNTSLAGQLIQESETNPQLLASWSIANLNKSPSVAFEAALRAVDALGNQPMPALSPALYALLAQAAQQAGQTGQAYAAIKQALSMWNNEPRWHSMAAHLAQSNGMIAEQIQHLEKAAVLEAEVASHWVALGNAQHQYGSLGRAIQAFETASTLLPDDPQVQQVLTELYIERGDMVKALSQAEKAVNSAPRSAAAHALLAKTLLHSGESASALKAAQHANQLDGQDVMAQHTLGLAQAAAGQPAQALQTLAIAASHAVNPLPILLDRVAIIRKHEDIQAAYTELDKLADQHPEEPAVLLPLAQTLTEQGRRDAALKVAQAALQTNLESLTQSQRIQLYTLLGRLFRLSGQLDQAVNFLSQAINEDNHSSVEVYLELGRAYQDRRELKQALTIYEQAISLSPKDSRPYQQAGLIHKETRDYQAAESMLRKAAELAPHDLSIQRLLGSLVALNLVQSAA